MAVNTATTRKVSVPSTRPVSPWMTADTQTQQKNNDVMRRYSAATIRSEKTPTFDVEDHPPLPSQHHEKKNKMKKSETFYAKFVKNVLSSSRRQSKDARYIPYLKSTHTHTSNLL